MKICKKCDKEKPLTEFTSELRPCRECVKEYNQQYRQRNAEKLKNYEKTKYLEKGDEIRQRNREFRRNNLELVKERQKLYREANAEVLAEKDRAKTRKLKQEVILAYGDNCDCCKETTMEFLTIDHIDGGGGTHRKEVGYGQRFYKWLKDNNYPQGYRVLCFNCNCSLGLRGYCPHKDGSKFSQA